MPQDMPTLEMVRLFHERFWIEQGYQQLKEELGLDHHEGRSWDRLASACTAGHSCIRLFDAPEHTGEKSIQQSQWYQRMGMAQSSLSQ